VCVSVSVVCLKCAVLSYHQMLVREDHTYSCSGERLQIGKVSLDVVYLNAEGAAPHAEPNRVRERQLQRLLRLQEKRCSTA
jgi:hypothetical protein